MTTSLFGGGAGAAQSKLGTSLFGGGAPASGASGGVDGDGEGGDPCQCGVIALWCC